jgi:hypothetical protein
METCYKMFRREVIQSIPLEENRFGFEPEITVKIAKRRLRIYEVGISYWGRTYEEGKKIGLERWYARVMVSAQVFDQGTAPESAFLGEDRECARRSIEATGFWRGCFAPLIVAARSANSCKTTWQGVFQSISPTTIATDAGSLPKEGCSGSKSPHSTRREGVTNRPPKLRETKRHNESAQAV